MKDKAYKFSGGGDRYFPMYVLIKPDTPQIGDLTFTVVVEVLDGGA